MIENGAVTVLFLTTALLVSGQQADRGTIDRRELAAYRLTTADFEQFRDASARIALVITDDASFRAQPLFSEEITQSGDVTEAGASLEARLRSHTGLSQALTAAKISARGYTKCALTLIAARLSRFRGTEIGASRGRGRQRGVRARASNGGGRDAERTRHRNQVVRRRGTSSAEKRLGCTRRRQNSRLNQVVASTRVWQVLPSARRSRS